MHQEFRILLLTPKDESGFKFDSLAPSIGVHRLQHAMAVAGIDCDVVNLELTPLEEVLVDVSNGHYHIIGVSVTHWNMIQELDLLWKLRETAKSAGHPVLFIAGGLVATMNCYEWLTCGFDLICLGFAERILVEVAHRYRESPGTGINVTQLFGDMAGVACLDGDGALVKNPAAPLSDEDYREFFLENDLAMTMPYAQYWEIVRKNAKGLTYNKRSFVIENARLFTASRCLANCGYCSSSAAFLRSALGEGQPSFYLLPAQDVYRLIRDHVERYGAQAFSFNDEDFLVGNRTGMQRARKMLRLIIDGKARGELPASIRFSCQTRPSTFIFKGEDGNKRIDREMMQLLLDAGFHNVSLGVETLSDRLLKAPSINKAYLTSQEILNVLDAIMEVGLFPTINVILLIPESTIPDLLETVRKILCYMTRPSQINVVDYMMAFPGAPLWKNPDYPTQDREWRHPLTGQVLRIPFYYRLWDADLQALFNKMENAAEEELSTIKRNFGWEDGRLIFRSAKALASFRAIARLTGAKDILHTCDRMIAEMGATAE